MGETQWWIPVLAGAGAGLVTSLAVHALLEMPLLRVKIHDDVKILVADDPSEDSQMLVTSVLAITNLRGRPVTIGEVLLRGDRKNIKPLKWNESLPKRLGEGDSLRIEFDRSHLPEHRVSPFAVDGAQRIWPRRRRPGHWVRARLQMGFSRKNGPSERRLNRLREKAQKKHAERESDGDS